jgi:uncharacterized protein with FMN-binding domain
VRRAVLAVAGLAASTTLLVVVKGGADASPATVGAVATAPPADGLAAVGGTPSPGPQALAPAPTDAPSDDGADDGSEPEPDATTTKPKKTTKPPADDEEPPPPPSDQRTFTGTREENPYGAVQLEITVDGSRMVDIRAIEMPDSESRSDQLSDQVSVQLEAEALREQGADLDTVSGATETAISYRDSLRAAIEEWK